MAKMHGNGKGISRSAIPYVRAAPTWCKTSPEEIATQICKLARKGTPPSRIGSILRDQFGIGQVSNVTGSKIIRILKANGLAPEIPEDLYSLIKNAVALRKHLSTNKRDVDAKHRLILMESRIHRLARYYRKTRRVAPTFAYKATTASALLASMQ
ncbi:ribosomal protein S15P [Kipferlia bialata]|uniref:Ribosomal protein S15P n=1 Tax=Kipferlia bialata TaxID=797122 RepID=A0A9K3D4J0_9EUKA|nr:ribosomal protein S15P [Kipferlia bialata]|eukprot:g10492.t1